MTPARHRLLAWGLAALLAAGVLAVLAPLPLGLVDAATEADALTARLAAATARRPDLGRLEARLAALDAADAAAAAVLRAPDPPAAERAFAAHLATVLAGAGSEAADERPLPSLAEGGLVALRQRVAVRLAPAALEPLLFALETARPAVFVEAIEAERRGDDALALTLTLRAYAEIGPVRAAGATPTVEAATATSPKPAAGGDGEVVPR